MADPLLGASLDGRYRVLECIGVGGMGRVYRARQESAIGREVAIKVLDSALPNDPLTRRFETEAKILAELRHPNTLRLVDSGRLADGRLYIVTDLLRGQLLEDLLVERQSLGVAETLRIVAQVADSLAEAHALGIVHRDLKPGNIFLEQVGAQQIVRVLDFGIAKVLHEPGLTLPMQIFGTPAYMSPEQATGQPVDARTDIYSLGVIAYECLAGRPPFASEFVMSILRMHVLERPKSLREFPALRTVDVELATLVETMLAKAPADRPARIELVRDGVAQIERRLFGGTPKFVRRAAAADELATVAMSPGDARELTDEPQGYSDTIVDGPELLVPRGPRATEPPEVTEGRAPPPGSSVLDGPTVATRADAELDEPVDHTITTVDRTEPGVPEAAAPSVLPDDEPSTAPAALEAPMAFERTPVSLDQFRHVSASVPELPLARRRLRGYEVLLLVALALLVLASLSIAWRARRAAEVVELRPDELLEPVTPRVLARPATPELQTTSASVTPGAARATAGVATEATSPAVAPADPAQRRRATKAARGEPVLLDRARSEGAAREAPPPGFMDTPPTQH
ncbi:protein kinase [Myxococcota bacterium]|nr:protein kinase [Myxococcota bacterium]